MENPRRSQKDPVVVITGPTASGKSELAVSIGEAIRSEGLLRDEGVEGAEIVNADSVQLYRDFDIGSAKPTREQRARVPHHLISVIDPRTPCDVAEFTALARAKIAELSDRRTLPIVVGGTGLYIRSLLCGIVPDALTDGARETAEAEISARERVFHSFSLSLDEFCATMYSWLVELDPRSAARIRPSDLVRIRRALVVALSSGESLASLQELHQFSDRPYRAFVLVMSPERHVLYRGIEERVDAMVKAGFREEVRRLRNQYPPDVRPFGALGYRQFVELEKRIERHRLCGEATLRAMEEAVAEVKRRTKNYAKRQCTWWRHEPGRLGWKDVTAEVAEVLLTGKDAWKKRNGVMALLCRFVCRTAPFVGDDIFVVRSGGGADSGFRIE